MKAPLTVHTSVDSFNNDIPILYYSSAYLKSQDHQNFVCYENIHFFLPVSIRQEFAISIPRSPFGSFFVKDKCNVDEFLFFLDQVKNDLNMRGAQSLKLIHPPRIYSKFTPVDWLSTAGFTEDYEDINQHIPLKAEWIDHIHDMQKRKLVSLREEGFEFKKMDINELETAHKFIEVCRLAQELNINTSFELLSKLSDSTNSYDIFGVSRDSKISALCITARVDEKTAYYYLPATSPMFRSQSPMVLLIAGMVGHYQSQGFEYFDMGVSSTEGKLQESLRIFKERMGAVQQEKPSLTLQI